MAAGNTRDGESMPLDCDVDDDVVDDDDSVDDDEDEVTLIVISSCVEADIIGNVDRDGDDDEDEDEVTPTDCSVLWLPAAVGDVWDDLAA